MDSVYTWYGDRHWSNIYSYCPQPARDLKVKVTDFEL